VIGQRFDRSAAERILQRAIELEDDRDPSTPFEGLSEATLREAAEELGIPASAVQQAAAEERLGVLEGTDRRADRLVGPGVVTAVRIVDGRRSDVLAHTDEWLRRAAFRRRRFSPSFAEYSRRGDPVAVAQRAVRSVGGHEGLGSVRQLRVTAEPIGADATVLALIVDLEPQRKLTLAGGGSVAGAGITASAVEASLVTPWIWLGVPASVAAGYGILRARARTLPDIETALNGALDRIAAADLPPSALGGVRDQLTSRGLSRTIREQMAAVRGSARS